MRQISATAVPLNVHTERGANTKFAHGFVAAWTKVMNADHFDLA